MPRKERINTSPYLGPITNGLGFGRFRCPGTGHAGINALAVTVVEVQVQTIGVIADLVIPDKTDGTNGFVTVAELDGVLA